MGKEILRKEGREEQFEFLPDFGERPSGFLGVRSSPTGRGDVGETGLTARENPSELDERTALNVN